MFSFSEQDIVLFKEEREEVHFNLYICIHFVTRDTALSTVFKYMGIC